MLLATKEMLKLRVCVTVVLPAGSLRDATAHTACQVKLAKSMLTLQSGKQKSSVKVAQAFVQLPV